MFFPLISILTDENAVPIVVEEVEMIEVKASKRYAKKSSEWLNLEEKFQQEILCPYCYIWYKEERDFNHHLSLHLPPNSKWCGFCQKPFAASYLRRHIKKFHVLRRFLFADGVTAMKPFRQADLNPKRFDLLLILFYSGLKKICAFSGYNLRWHLHPG